MSSSLDKLVSNLPDEAFKYTKEICENELFRLMKKKKEFILTIVWLVFYNLTKRNS